MLLTVHLPDKSIKLFDDLTKDTTIAEILIRSEIRHQDVVVFTGSPNSGNNTPLVKFDLTLESYNMWINEKGEKNAICVFLREDIDSYNVSLYNMYANIW
jgi:hypothetical protein